MWLQSWRLSLSLNKSLTVSNYVTLLWTAVLVQYILLLLHLMDKELKKGRTKFVGITLSRFMHYDFYRICPLLYANCTQECIFVIQALQICLCHVLTDSCLSVLQLPVSARKRRFFNAIHSPCISSAFTLIRSSYFSKQCIVHTIYSHPMTSDSYTIIASSCVTKTDCNEWSLW